MKPTPVFHSSILASHPSAAVQSLSKGFIFLMVLYSLASCAGVKETLPGKLYPLKQNTILLNGQYSNVPVPDSNTAIQLWKILSVKKPYYLFTAEDSLPDMMVQLQVINSHSIAAKLYSGTNIINELLLKGHFEENYFSVRRKIRWLGVPFIYLAFSNAKTKIGKDITGNLVVDGVRGSFGMIFIASAGNNDWYNLTYKKYEN
jgi:hypothetical protein